MNKMNIQRQDRFSSDSHLCGAIIVLVGVLALVYQTRDCPSLIMVSVIYGLSAFFMLVSSALYHAFKIGENQTSFLRKMDHFAIFCMIAGTYTPVCYLCLDGAWRWSIIAIQWGLVGFGLISQIAFPGAPRVLHTIICIVMGWIAIVPIRQILAAMNTTQAILMFTGGAAYTLGALIYATRKPRLFPGIFGFHELFHLMVLIGAGLHYTMIYTAYIQKVA
jgi:hemolysin III